MVHRLTDSAGAALRDGFRRRVEAPERDVVAALAKPDAVARRLLAAAGVAPGDLAADGVSVGHRELLALGVEVARQRGVGYVGTEHLLLAVAGLPGSALAKCGATPEVLGEWLSAIVGESPAHPGTIRRLAGWCRRACQWSRGRARGE